MARCGILFSNWKEAKLIEELNAVINVDMSEDDFSISESEDNFSISESEETLEQSVSDDYENSSSCVGAHTVEDIKQCLLMQSHFKDWGKESQNLKDVNSDFRSSSGMDLEHLLPCSSSALDNLSEHPNLVPVIIKSEPVSHYSPPDSTSPKLLPCLPASKNWKGEHNFDVNFNLQTGVGKNEGVAYAKEIDKLFVSKDDAIPAIVCAEKVPSNTIIRTTAVYVLAEHASEVVRRCLIHSQEDAVKGILEHEHVIQSLSDAAIYEKNSFTGRYSVTVPYEKPQDGEEFSTYLYKFTCFSSCAGGLNRRPLMAIFTLEKNGHILGRRAVEVRICASPIRDYKIEMERIFKKNVTWTIQPEQSVFPNPASIQQNGTVSTGASSSGTCYRLTVHDKKLYEFLKEMKHFYEVSKLVHAVTSDS